MVTVIIAAAGSGSRMGRGMNKVFIPLFACPILVRTVEVFDKITAVDHMIVVVGQNDVKQCEALLQQRPLKKRYKIIAGGSERQLSISNALHNLFGDEEIIIVHDGARPLVDDTVIYKSIEAARQYGAVAAGVKVKDTIKYVSDNGVVCQTPDRSKLWAVQTPQAFKRDIIVKAYELAAREGFIGTDDASLVERMGYPVRMIAGSYNNIKVTTPEDLLIAEALLKGGEKEIMRVGMGYDVHKLVEGRDLILGGVAIPYEYGLEGHSDADVLLHAIKDALLGAAGLGDIGRHFPDTDNSFKGISSLILLDKVGQLLKQHHYCVCNIDATIMAQRPKLAFYIPEMNANIAKVLDIPLSHVNVKATTTEGLGFVGRKEGIAACAVAMINDCE